MSFLFAGTYASIALASSILVKNKFVVIIIPFLISTILDMISQFTFNSSIGGSILLQIENDCNVFIKLTYIFVVTIISFCTFKIGGKRYEHF